MNRSEQNKMELSLDKLLLLMPLNCEMNDTDDLIAFDEKMKKINDYCQNTHRFSVYRCTIDDDECRYFAIHCVTDPLIVLRQMRESSRSKSITLETYNDEVKLLYRTLLQILENPPSSDYDSTRRGLLVPITVKNGEEKSLRNGGLVRWIMNKVDPSYVFKHIDSNLKPISSGFVQQWKRKWKGSGECTQNEERGNTALHLGERNKDSDGSNVQLMKKKNDRALQGNYKEIRGSCANSNGTHRAKDV